ncbi:MAG: putative glycoside hydrolase [Lachnospiraceae bacterium]|jgi:hypothetical protein
MKKCLAILLLLVLSAALLALSGCKNSANNKDSLSSKQTTTEAPKSEIFYLASENTEVPLYTYDKENCVFTQVTSAVRGTEVQFDGKYVTSKGKYVNEKKAKREPEPVPESSTDPEGKTSDILLAYIMEITLGGSKYLVNPDNLSQTLSGAVMEKCKYVRTPVTVYENPSGANISGWLPKGSCLEISGFDYLMEDGQVNKYFVACDETEGWVYRKYLVDDEASALAVNEEYFEMNKDGIYSAFDLYGGDPGNLDYYPYERISIPGNNPPEDVRGMYLNCAAAMDAEDYIELAQSCGVNAVVIDIKDGVLAYEAEAARDISPASFETSLHYFEPFKEAVQKYKDAGLYTIGRIVVFSDAIFAGDNPQTVIESYLTDGTWPSAFSREVWEYNVQLAVESVERMGFNEIQFDYVRFPENAYSISKNDPDADYKNYYGEEKAEAVQNFLFYATDTLHEAGAYVSVDVFGESANGYVTAYGQYWPAITNIVDAISGMPYVDHFGTEDVWTYPYNIMYYWATNAAQCQTQAPTPAAVRTWITGYNTPHWNPTVNYGSEKISEQAQALYDAGLTGGFIPWNAASSYWKYAEFADAWGYSYEDLNAEEPEFSPD